MDFGSSHVYVGDQSASTTYNTSIPKEEIKENHYSNKENQVTFDPVYEAIDDDAKVLNRQNNSGPSKENEYDLVADDNRNQTTAWDEVPGDKPPPIPAKPSIYSNQPVKQNGGDVSLAMRLRQALKERDKNMKKKIPNQPESSTRSITNDIKTSSVPPKKPPRKKRNATCGPVPIRKAPPPPPAPKLPPKNSSLEEIKTNVHTAEGAACQEVDPQVAPSKQNTFYEEVETNTASQQISDEQVHQGVLPIQNSSEELHLNEPSNVLNTVSDSLIDFSSDCIVPILAPPPEITISRKCLPNVPYNPFDDAITNDTGIDVIGGIPLLQPVLINNSGPETSNSKEPSVNLNNCDFSANNMNWADSGSASSAKTDILALQPTLLNGTDQSRVVDEETPTIQNRFLGLNLSNSKGENQNFANFSTAFDQFLLDSNKPRRDVIPNHYVATESNVANDTQNKNPFLPENPFLTNSQPSLFYPSLFPVNSNGDGLITNGLGQSSVTPTAPARTPSMVRKDTEFLQNQLKQAHLDLHSLDFNVSADELDVTSLEPSAPILTPTMAYRDEQHRNVERSSSRASSNDTTYAAADTNVVCIKLGIVADNQNSVLIRSPPSQCASCRGINNSTAEKWECIFCSAINKTPVQNDSPSSALDVTYVLQSPTLLPSPPESLIVFCVDTSGSMVSSSKVENAYISRLKALQIAITDQLNIIEAQRPNTRVALVTFNDYVNFLGDGSPEQRRSLSEFELFDFDFLTHTGTMAPLPGQIRDTRPKLAKAVMDLKEGGGTALGPALLLSTVLAARLPGSQVIVCTDGRANVGVGSLETEDEYSMCHHFYDQTTTMAASYGVIVNVLAIAGTDCRLVQLGKISDKTAGKVNIVENNTISQEFVSILSDRVLATNVSIDLVTHRQLYFKRQTEIVGSNVAQFIGNITNDSEVTFQYGVRADEEFATMAPPRDAPFQLKIIYRTPDGGVYMRVLTQVRPVTESRELAETEMNPAVLGAFAAQYAARLALEGDLDNAREVTSAHKNLVARGLSLKSQYGSSADESIYDCVSKRMDDIGSELNKADTASTCSSEKDATYNDPDLIEEEEENGIAAPPPALPPRRQNSKPEHHGSMSSIHAKLAKLPSIPKGPLGKKKKRSKKSTAMQFKDKTAVNIFKFSKASSASFNPAS